MSKKPQALCNPLPTMGNGLHSPLSQKRLNMLLEQLRRHVLQAASSQKTPDVHKIGM